MPLAKPSVAAIATSCHVSRWFQASIMPPKLFGLLEPCGLALAEERRDAFAAFRRCAHGRDVLRGAVDHAVVDRPMRDAANRRLAIELRGRTRRAKRRDHRVDPRV